jgi:hypothetical protein
MLAGEFSNNKRSACPHISVRAANGNQAGELRSLDVERKRHLFRPECFLPVDSPGLIGVRRHGYVKLNENLHVKNLVWINHVSGDVRHTVASADERAEEMVCKRRKQPNVPVDQTTYPTVGINPTKLSGRRELTQKQRCAYQPAALGRLNEPSPATNPILLNRRLARLTNGKSGRTHQSSFGGQKTATQSHNNLKNLQCDEAADSSLWLWQSLAKALKLGIRL